MDRLRTMEVFARVAESGSFTAAAQALRIPKASATTAVQELEARLGVRLLHRTTRRVALTSDGATYYEEVRRLLDGFAALESGLGAASASLRGRVRIDVPAAAARRVLAPALPAFLARHPGLVVELGSTDRPVDLVGEGVDCVIRGGDLHDDTLVARKLGELAVVTCASPTYLAARGLPVHPDDLGAHAAVSYFSARTGRHFALDFVRGDQARTWVPPFQVAANDTDTWIALAEAGLGLLQTPLGAGMRERLDDGRLVRVLPDWSSEPLPLFVMYPRDRHLAARVRVVVDWLAEIYAEECRMSWAYLDRSAGAGHPAH